MLRNELAGFDRQTGKLLWRQSYSSGGYDEHAAFPLYEEPYLRTMQPFRGGSDLYRLQSVPPSSSPDRSDVCLDLVRHDGQMSNDVASSVLVDGCIYGFASAYAGRSVLGQASATGRRGWLAGSGCRRLPSPILRGLLRVDPPPQPCAGLVFPAYNSNSMNTASGSGLYR